MLVKKLSSLNLIINLTTIIFIVFISTIFIFNSSNGASHTSAMMSSPVDNRKPKPSPTPTPKPRPSPTSKPTPTPTFRPTIRPIIPTKPPVIKPTTKPQPAPTRKPYRTSNILINSSNAELATITNVHNTSVVI